MYNNQQQPAYGYSQPATGQVVGGYPPQQQQYGYQQQPQQQAYYPPQQPQQQQQAYYPPQQQQAYYQDPKNGPYTPANNNNGAATYYAPPPAAGGAVEPYMAQGVPLYEEFANDSATASLTGAAGAGGRKFVVQGYKDIWAAIFFILFSIGIIAAGSYHMKKYLFADIDTDGFRPGRSVLFAGIGVGAGLVFGIISLGIFYLAPRASIIGANALIVLIFLGIGGIFGYYGQLGACFTFVLLGLLRILIVYMYRKFLPMSGLFLRQASILAKRYPLGTIFSFVTLLLAAVWCVMTFSAGYPVLADTINGHNKKSTGAVVAMWIFLVFGCYLSTQVAFNLGHTTFCGITATWYFCGERNMPKNPTLHSAKRALTTSFGSIVFGSLLVAIIRAIRTMIRALGSRDSFLGCIALCLLSCIEGILRMFNHFAFVYIAMYGCGYIEGAKRTMDLVKESRYMPLIGNLLIDGTLFMFEFIISIAVGFVVLMINREKRKRDEHDDRWTGDALVYGLFAAIACMITMAQLFRVIDSSTTTLLVCLSEEPQMVFQTNPNFGGELADQTNFAEVEAAAAAARNGQQQSPQSPNGQHMTSRV